MATRYVVYESGKLARWDYPPGAPTRAWGNCHFDTEQEAQTYASEWLGEWFTGQPLVVNCPYDYSGYGDMIEIRKEEV